MNKEAFDYNALSAFDECGVNYEAIDRVVHWYDGDNDGESWMFVLHMKSGNWIYGEAWCDYTGWDCQAGGESFSANTEEELAMNRMTLEARRIFGYPDGLPLK